MELHDASASKGENGMTRVLVVGSDTREEQVLLGRLRQVAGLPPEALQRCVDLDQCDLLLVRDTPALRSAAQHMVSKRPGMRLWMHDDAGVVQDGRAAAPLYLDDAQIQRALAPAAPTEALTTDGLFLASGAKQVTRLLRQRLQEKKGRALLTLQGQPQMLIDFEHDQAVPLYLHPHQGPGLAQQLGEVFELLALQELSIARFQALAETLPRQPLRPLLWQMAQHGDNWTDFDRRLQQHAVVSLLRWPDFRVLAHQHDGFRLCSLLLKKACSLQECTRLLELDVDATRGFMRSAYLCGYAEVRVVEHAPERPAAAARSNASTLLARMWRSVRQRKGSDA